jgi:hypothetical protein
MMTPPRLRAGVPCRLRRLQSHAAQSLCQPANPVPTCANLCPRSPTTHSSRASRRLAWLAPLAVRLALVDYRHARRLEVYFNQRRPAYVDLLSMELNEALDARRTTLTTSRELFTPARCFHVRKKCSLSVSGRRAEHPVLSGSCALRRGSLSDRRLWSSRSTGPVARVTRAERRALHQYKRNVFLPGPSAKPPSPKVAPFSLCDSCPR